MRKKSVKVKIFGHQKHKKILKKPEVKDDEFAAESCPCVHGQL